MTNIAQFLLIVVILTLTALLVFVTIEVVHLLRDIRQVVKTFKGSSPKQLYEEIKKVAATPRHFFHRKGTPLKP